MTESDMIGARAKGMDGKSPYIPISYIYTSSVKTKIIVTWIALKSNHKVSHENFKDDKEMHENIPLRKVIYLDRVIKHYNMTKFIDIPSPLQE